MIGGIGYIQWREDNLIQSDVCDALEVHIGLFFQIKKTCDILWIGGKNLENVADDIFVGDVHRNHGELKGRDAVAASIERPNHLEENRVFRAVQEGAIADEEALGQGVRGVVKNRSWRREVGEGIGENLELGVYDRDTAPTSSTSTSTSTWMSGPIRFKGL